MRLFKRAADSSFFALVMNVSSLEFTRRTPVTWCRRPCSDRNPALYSAGVWLPWQAWTAIAA